MGSYRLRSVVLDFLRGLDELKEQALAAALRNVLATKFDDYISEVEERAKAGGPEALARWDAFNAHYAMAREVRELRKERHLTQKQLAAASGINQAEISRIERGQTNPTASTLAALLAPLGARVGVVPREKRDLAHV